MQLRSITHTLKRKTFCCMENNIAQQQYNGGGSDSHATRQDEFDAG